MRKLASWAFTLQLLAVMAALLSSAATADAATISTQNSVVLLRVGNGAAALTANAAPVFLDEYAITYTGHVPTGATHVQTIPVPDTGIPEGTKLLIGGTASLEGSLNLSANGQYLMFAGNNSLA